MAAAAVPRIQTPLDIDSFAEMCRVNRKLDQSEKDLEKAKKDLEHMKLGVNGLIFMLIFGALIILLETVIIVAVDPWLPFPIIMLSGMCVIIYAMRTRLSYRPE